MQTLKHSEEGDKDGGSAPQSFLRRYRVLWAVLLLCLILLLASSLPSTVLAQSGYVNLLQNPFFETGQLPPSWNRWVATPTAPGIVYVESCCANHTPGGTYNAAIEPRGQEVVMYQNVSVVSGKKYWLDAWLSTDQGMAALLRWWSDTSGVARLCDSTQAVWPEYPQASCDFYVPTNTQYFNVQLSGNAPWGQWAVTDDWSLRTTDLLQNPGFETGNISPWTKWPSDSAGSIGQQVGQNRTPDGNLSGFIRSAGQEVVMFQSVSVAPGQKYVLSAWVSTSDATTAYLRWWSSADNFARVCGQTNVRWPAYAYLSCELTVPPNTVYFNVQLSAGSAPANAYVYVDDWALDWPVEYGQVPSCRWPHTAGVITTIKYRWGSELQNPDTTDKMQWRSAFETGIVNWNVAPTKLLFSYSTTGSVVINTEYKLGGVRGYAQATCVDGTTTGYEVIGNRYYTYTDTGRNAIAGHELGHSQSIGHIISSSRALMHPRTALEYYAPQATDFYIVNLVYR